MGTVINLSEYREPVRYRPETGQMFYFQPRINGYELRATILDNRNEDWFWCEIETRAGVWRYRTWVHLSDLHPLRNDRPCDTEEA